MYAWLAYLQNQTATKFKWRCREGLARWMADASLEEISTLDSQYPDISSVWSPAKDNHTDPLASVPTVHDWLTSGKTINMRNMEKWCLAASTLHRKYRHINHERLCCNIKDNGWELRGQPVVQLCGQDILTNGDSWMTVETSMIWSELNEFCQFIDRGRVNQHTSPLQADGQTKSGQKSQKPNVHAIKSQ